jgi:hypothetical protein
MGYTRKTIGFSKACRTCLPTLSPVPEARSILSSLLSPAPRAAAYRIGEVG